MDPLVASWEPSWASCGSLGRSLDPKMLKNCGFFKGFEKAVFWSLKLLMGLFVHLGCFLGKFGGQVRVPKGVTKVRLKRFKN